MASRILCRRTPTVKHSCSSTACTLVRRTELSCYRAFSDPDGAVTREDMILALNRLSSLCWILMIRLKAGQH